MNVRKNTQTTLFTLTHERIHARARELWIEAGEPAGGLESFLKSALDDIRATEAAYDKTVADSFPASDPPANSGITP